MFTKILYAGAIAGLLISFQKDKNKTKAALKKAWKSFENILPSVLAVLLLIGFILTFLDTEMISRLIGADSGIMGMGVAAIIGCITLIPGFVAFPLAASLLEAGAGSSKSFCGKSFGDAVCYTSDFYFAGIDGCMGSQRDDHEIYGKRSRDQRQCFCVCPGFLFSRTVVCVISCCGSIFEERGSTGEYIDFYRCMVHNKNTDDAV